MTPMFNSRQLQDLAKAKAQAVTDQRNNQGTVEVQPQEGFGILSDPNEAYIAVCNVGYSPGEASKIVMQGPEAVSGALGFGHGSSPGPEGSTVSTTQQYGQPVPIQQQGNPGGMANALMGVGNIVRSNNGQQPNHNGGATNASNMFNTLAGVNNIVRGNNGTQPTYQPEPVQYTPPPHQSYAEPGMGHLYSSEPQVYPGQQQQGPQWTPVQNSAAAGPPGHGGGNPGFSGMMSNTGDTMAALKALAERMRNRS